MSSTIVMTPDGDPVIIIERIFDAPQALMFRMFTDPFHLAQFWGPHGSTNPVCEMDVRPGGIWRHVMRFAGGNEHAVDSMFIEVVEPERIVYRDLPSGSEDNLANLPPPQLVTTILFEKLGERTKLVGRVRATSIAGRDQAIRMGFANVVSQSYERLAAYLQSQQDNPRSAAS